MITNNQLTVPDGTELPPSQRELRSGRLFASTMRIPGLGEQTVAVRNLSPRGAGLRARIPPPVGILIMIKLGHYGEVEGRVRWVDGQLFGVALADPIDPDSFNFAAKKWDNLAESIGNCQVADRFRPETSTYRPGFRRR
ncbi:MAG: PilZ domain-containing protein [Pseudomonadota bacterium]